MRHALYIVGAPGAGKTTLVRALTRPWARAVGRRPIAHVHYPGAGVVQLGAERDAFGGTDALAMNAVVAAAAWVQEPENPVLWPANLLIAEGDRLACDRFFEALVAGGWALTVAHVNTPPDVAATRRALRGGGQKDSWVRGRQTKVERLVERWAPRGHVVELDGTQTTEHLVERLNTNPVASALAGEYDVWS